MSRTVKWIVGSILGLTIVCVVFAALGYVALGVVNAARSSEQANIVAPFPTDGGRTAGQEIHSNVEGGDVVANEVTESEVVVAEVVTPTVEITPTVVAVVPDLADSVVVTNGVTSTAVLTYTPGGLNYTYPEVGSLEEIDPVLLDGDEGWTRVRRAANGQFLTWSFLVRVTADQPLDDVCQWSEATLLTCANASDSVLNIKVEVRRDFIAKDDDECHAPCTPYLDAAGGDTKAVLGWFFRGFGNIAVNGVEDELTGLGVTQVSFPEDADGIYVFDYVLEPKEFVSVNLGVRVTTVDNYPQPK